MELSSMHNAAKVGDESKVKYFFDLGTSVDDRDNKQCTPLHHAAKRGHFGVAKFLISNKCDLDAQKYDGTTALMLAAGRGHGDITELLLKSGADLTCRDNWNWTALHFAANRGCLRSVEAILARETNVDAKTIKGETALMLAASWGEQEGQEEIVEAILQSGADVRLFDNDYRTALHHICYYGCLDAVKAILKRGPDLDAKTVRGETALQIAAERRRIGVELLLQSGAQINLQGSHLP